MEAAIDMNAIRRDDDNLGYLRATIEALARRVDEGFDDAKKHRCAVRQDLAEISEKVDPLLNRMTTVEMKNQALEAVMTAWTSERAERQAIFKFLRRTKQVALFIVFPIMLFWSEQIKPPIMKLFNFLTKLG